MNDDIYGSMSFSLLRKRPAPEKKVLVIRFGAIGDIVLTSPVLRCLKQQLEGYEIHFLTKRIHLPLVQHNPHLDKIFTIENEVEEVIKQMQAENYEHVIDLHDNLRSFQTCVQLRANIHRYNKRRFRRWLYTTFKIRAMPKEHVVDRYFGAVKSLGVKNDLKGLEFFIPEDQKFDPSKLPLTHSAGYAALVIGAKHFTKKLPYAQLEKLCRELPVPVIIIGGKEDFETGALLEMIDPFKILNLCGRHSLLTSASIVARAKWVITHDTGMMHIAAAFKRKIISIWGCTTPELGFTPYYPQQGVSHIIEAKNVSCRPCHKHGRNKCPRGHFNCMNLVDTTAVSSIIRSAAGEDHLNL
jgi:ADP-heptose:LPS heptosyltransferase